MNPFKILQIRKMVKEARENPSKLAGEQVREMLWGLLIVPIVVGVLVLGLFFIMGYTHLFGFTLGIFRFLFWLGLVPSLIAFLMFRKLIVSASKISVRQTERVVEAVGQEVKDEKGI